MKERMAVILAAGKGTRMKSKVYKVMHLINGLPMIEHVFRSVKTSGVDEIVTIVGHGAETVQNALGSASHYALQEKQLGTGHAVLQAESQLEDKEGATLVICGDTPLISAETIQELFDYHEQNGYKGTVLTTHVDNPYGYGRIIRQSDGNVTRIVEEKDATDEERSINEINTGTYVFDNQLLFKALHTVGNQNASGEYYLPDVVEILRQQGHLVGAYMMPNREEATGVNDRIALSKASKLMQKRINHFHMQQGVTIINPETTYIEADVIIGSDTVIEPGVQLRGNTIIGNDCIIGAYSDIRDSKVADRVMITQSVIEESSIETGSTIGPFAHLRPNSKLEADVHIGNFVEVKNSTVGAKTRAGHLTYIGDADLGNNINLGCGTIFVNYDGKSKHRSTVGDDAFIGCNANIISPVTIEEQTIIAAGTTVTDNVPPRSLAIGRARQKIVADYWEKFNSK